MTGRLLALCTVGFALGCQKPASTQPTTADAPAELEPAPPAPTPAADEDPEVAAYVKKHGWRLGPDVRISDGKRLVYLGVQHKDKPFEDVALSAADYQMLARSKTVQVLDLRRVKATDAGVKAVAAIPQLEGIILSGDDVTDAGIKELAGCKSLDNVTLFTKKVTDAGIKELAALPKLQSLYAGFLTLDGSAFAAFAGSKTLESLTLDYVDGFTDDGAGHVAKLTSLKELKIKAGFGGRKLTAAGIKAIVDARLPPVFEFDKKLIDDDLFVALVAKGWLYGPTPPGAREKRPAKSTDVRSINLDGSRVTDRGLKAVLNCTSVESLFLGNTGVTDATFKKLGGFKKLNYLSLEKTKITAAGLEAVAGLPIKHVAMEGCELSEDSFKAFGKMAALEELWLSNTKMKPEWLAHISKLPKLKELNLMSAAFDDAAVKHVAGLPELQDLTLNYTALGDAGFQELVKLPKVRRLFVDGTKVTRPVYQQAKKDHPKLSLYFYRYDQ